MLSDKMTLSLTSLVVLLAFGFICFVPTASAHDNKTETAAEFNVKLVAAESMMDVSYKGDGADDNIQIMRQATGTDITISLLARFDVVVNLDDPTDTARQGTPVATDVTDRGTGAFEGGDIVIDAYDEKGRALGILPVAEADDVIELRHRDPNNPGKEFLILIDEGELAAAYSDIHSGGPFAIATLLVSIPEKKVEDATLGEILKLRKGEHFPHSNKFSNVFQVHFVMADDGDAKYANLATPDASVGAGTGAGIPGVVSVDRILDRSAFNPIETGPFNIRVILTEEPRSSDNKSGLTTDMIQVDGGGKATAVTAGLTYKGGANTDNAGSELTLAMIGEFRGIDNTAVTALTGLPNATGRDNRYHTYSVEITPNPGVDGDLTISIKQFMDHVKPVSKQYIPLSAEQRIATTLTGDAVNARNARVANETITVKVKTADAAKTDVTVAYEARKKVLDGVTNDTSLAEKLVVPAGGYLVIHNADIGDTGIVDPGNKVNTKKLDPAKALYNITKLSLTFPADDLDNFFRNGGTLNLGYADIPEATGSGDDKAKSPQADKAHADYTGYDGASTNAYTARALIINEIMWGLDGNDTTSQYIELYNPGTAAIGIDHMEWVISVGALPTGYTLIDSAGNNPASSYWEVPGSGGVTAVSADHPVVSDLVSMSRVTGSADGTAAASWVASERPSANVSGRRVGTPGAANQYTPAPTPTPTPPPPAPMVDVATGADIRVSEIMVASNEGRLAQWIELANVSSGEVSLNGWGITIDNDPDDADVVGARVNVELGDVTVDAEQVVLVVSKTSPRTSGVGMDEGDIREDRIVDVQDQVSDEDRYSLISEMAFKISLIPPQTSGVVEPGDVVGNLGEGWELPMSEDGRSSLIRREMDAAAMAQMGTSAAGWILASSTKLDGAYRTTYYGDDEDVGTPGYNAGGPLPVELSSFYPKRSEETGHVEITWKTQSELNNAGFFIKRSQQRDGKFVVVNPTMIPGAGTTSEEQSYTYTDTTAQPNVIYYYQIEDVSLDGQRQTLTLGTRLRGHIGAAGKATTIWGELKSQE